METDKPAPRNLAEALEILDTPIEVEIPFITLADGKPAGVRMRQQDLLTWSTKQSIFPLVTKPTPSIADDPGLVLQREKEWAEMGWEMLKLAVYEMRESSADGETEPKWTPVRLVEDAIPPGDGIVNRSRFRRCQAICFNALVYDFNTVQGVRLDDAGFREMGDEAPPRPDGADSGEVREDAARDSDGSP